MLSFSFRLMKTAARGTAESKAFGYLAKCVAALRELRH